MNSKLMKRMSALALSAVMALSLVACGDKKGNTAPKDDSAGKDPTEAVIAATEKLNSAKSFQADMTTQITMSMAGESIDMEMHMATTTFTDPLKSKVVMSSSGAGGVDLPETEVYLLADGDSYSVHVQSGNQWVSQELSPGEAGQFEPRANTNQYLSFAKSFTAAGTETVGNVEAQRYDGAITGKDIVQVLKTAATNNGSMQSFSNIVDSLPDPNAIEKMTGLQLSIWVDPATGYPIRQQLDMGAFMSDLMGAVAEASNVSMEELGFQVDAAVVTVDYANFDAAEDFEVPTDIQG